MSVAVATIRKEYNAAKSEYHKLGKKLAAATGLKSKTHKKKAKKAKKKHHRKHK